MKNFPERRKPAKPTIDTPDTLILGAYSEAGTAAVVGSYRTSAGDLRTEVVTATGTPWEALAAALAAAAVMLPANVLIFSNDAALVAALNPPFKPPAATETVKVWYSGTKLEKALPVNVGYGGNAEHWQCLAALGGTYGGRFGATLVSDLKKAKELWQLHTSPSKE